jgi:hypothetical protein
MDGNFQILKLIKGTVEPVNVTLVSDPQIFSPETPVYFFELGNPSGTYFANNYVTRHDVPDFSRWPNTMTALLLILSSPDAESLRALEKTYENFQRMDRLLDQVEVDMIHFIKTASKRRPSIEDGKFRNLDKIEIIDIDTSTKADIFGSGTFSYLTVGLYSSLSKMLSEILDSELPTHLRITQKELIETAIRSISKFLNSEAQQS